MAKHMPIKMGGWGDVFSESRIHRLIDQHDQTHEIKAGAMRIRVLLRYVSGGAELAGIHLDGADRGVVAFAFRVRDDLRQGGISALTPLELLEAILGRFGLEMMVGDQKRTLILQETFPIGADYDGKPIHVLNPNDHSSTKCGHIKVNAKPGEPPTSLELTLCFALDRTAYEEYLSET